MQQQVVTMLQLQEAMNSKVNPAWRTAGYEWYRAIWVECAELMDHYGWKWWKKQTPDINQVALELIDIWHFGLSIKLLEEEACDQGYQRVAQKISSDFDRTSPEQDFKLLLERFTEETLSTKGFSVGTFCDLIKVVGLSFEQLYIQYVGKNVLNMFRQDFGYQDGSYQKVWNGKEDNEHLVEVLSELDPGAPDFGAQLYTKLQARYTG